jgi:hypothetical protein
MHSYQIIYGFSDIKSAFRTKSRTEKSMSELRLWFSLSGGALFAHDYYEHSSCIIIAYKTDLGWLVRLDPKTFGHMLISETVNNCEEAKIVEALKVLYGEFGTYSN